MTAACVAYVGSAAWEDLPAALAAVRGRFGRVPVHPVAAPGEAEALAGEAEALAGELAGQVDVLLVFGGDGTVHEVANGLPVPAGEDGPLGALLPAGTGNGGSFGGGRWLLPDADVGDGQLDVLVVPAGASKAKLARALATGRRLPDDLPRRRGPAATVAADMPCRLDGEPAPTPESVTVVPAAWRLLAPRSG